jgi:tetratricopeptide (TPR) repeat protein
VNDGVAPHPTPALAGVVVSALLLAGCAGAPQAERLRAAVPAPLAAPQLLGQVPFIAQDDYQCGPASLAMALAASGAAVDLDTLTAQVYLPGRHGSLQPEMLAAARRHGRLAVVLAPRLDAVLTEVARGTPVVVLQNLSLPVAPVWHYAVVIGFDLAAGEVVLHSGLTAAQRLPLEVFERTWARSDRWAMVAAAPGALPATVAPAELLAAAAALERVDAAAARAAYAALTVRLPSLANAWFGLGNSALATHDPAAARQAFERTVRLAPEHADGWNNLAHVLLALGQATPALAAAQRAVALGGPRLERYRQTLAQIEGGR